MTAVAPRRAFLRGLTSLPLVGWTMALGASAACIPALAVEHPDAELLQLCKQSTDLVALYNTMDDVVYEDRWAEIDTINNRIRATPAKTMDGLIAKALIMRWEVNLNPPAHEAPRDWDWDVKCLDGFIQELRAFGRDWRESPR